MEPTRAQRLIAECKKAGVDCVAIMPGANLNYLAEVTFRLSERPTLAFVSAHTPPVAVVPAFEVTRFTAGPATRDWQVFAWTDETGPAEAFAGAAQALGLAGQTLAVEENTLRVAELRWLERSAPGLRLTAAEPLLSSLRIRKDAAELAKMRQAVAITEAALEAVLTGFRPGMTERVITNRLIMELRERGAEGLAFEPAVLAGPNSALPHGEPGDRPVVPGDLLLMDFGVTIRGYASDITRTVAIGEISPQLREIYAVVKAANEAGRAAARPGVEIQTVDQATRRVIVDAGYGAYFLHRTGHGLGLDVHEAPYACAGDTTQLEPGMTFTVEPGIYLPGQGGVRIEDDVVITPTGHESLTTFSRELRSL